MASGAPPLARPPHPRGILFDLDGVLVDSARAWHRVVEACAARHGCPQVPWEAFRSTFGQGPEADQRQFFPGASVEDVIAFYDDAFPREIQAVEVMTGAMRGRAASAPRSRSP